jgi:glycosyltransferase involved in cell wall biosynthesis
MRILVLHNRYQLPGGEDTAVAQEVSMLRRGGHTVDLLLENNDDIRTPFARIGAAVNSFYSLKSRNLVRARIRECKPDVVHVHNFVAKLTPSVYDACREVGVPVIQTLHNYRIICPGAILFRDGKPCETCVGMSLALPAIVHGCYRGSHVGTAVMAATFGLHRYLGTWNNSVARYIALTEFGRSKFIAGGLPPEKIIVKPNSADDPGPGKHEGDFLLYVGRLTEEKGIGVLLEAVKKNALPLPLKIVGNGPMQEDVARLADAGRLEWLPQCTREEVFRLMKDASCLLFPSLWFEGMPMVIVEGLATGLPIIASDLGSIPEMVKHGENGFLFHPRDTESLAKAVVDLCCSSREFQEQMRNNARAFYLDSFEPENNARQLLKIYRQSIRVHEQAARTVALA